MRLRNKIENFLTDHVLRVRKNWPMLLRITRSVWTSLSFSTPNVCVTIRRPCQFLTRLTKDYNNHLAVILWQLYIFWLKLPHCVNNGYIVLKFTFLSDGTRQSNYYNTGQGHAFYENKNGGYGFHENQNQGSRSYHAKKWRDLEAMIRIKFTSFLIWCTPL